MTKRKFQMVVALIGLPLALGGCAGAVGGGEADAIADRLFFGRNIPAGGMVSDSSWSAFLAEVVTPRFPDGLTVWRAEGQWRGANGRLEREPVMIVEVLHPRGTPPDSVFASIARDYCQRFGQDAVLRSTGAVRINLYDAAKEKP